MPTEEEIKAQQELLTAYRRTLVELLRQRALITASFVPPGVANGIQDARDQIRSIKKSLRAWGIKIDDYPNDEEILSSLPEPIGKGHLGSAGTTTSSHTGWYIGVLVIIASLSIASLMLFLRPRPEATALAPTAAPSTATDPGMPVIASTIALPITAGSEPPAPTTAPPTAAMATATIAPSPTFSPPPPTPAPPIQVSKVEIDAAVMWNNGYAYFFKGSQYIRFNVAKDEAEPTDPLPIAGNWKGLWPDGVDTGVVWNNGKAFFFKGSQYVRYDLAADAVDPGYPQPIAGNWKGLWPDGVDAGVVWNNGKAFFFKGGQYVRYDLAADAVDPGYPQPIEGNWRGPF